MIESKSKLPVSETSLGPHREGAAVHRLRDVRGGHRHPSAAQRRRHRIAVEGEVAGDVTVLAHHVEAIAPRPEAAFAAPCEAGLARAELGDQVQPLSHEVIGKALERARDKFFISPGRPRGLERHCGCPSMLA